MNLALRGVRHYWKANLAVAAGVATAVAVLAGALVVGDSVRASLRRLALERLGTTESMVAGPNLFREQLAKSFHGAAPLLVLEAAVTNPSSRRRTSNVVVYGVDERFWNLQGKPDPGLGDREAALSPALAADLGVEAGGSVIVRLSKPSDIPAESLFGRKEAGAGLRLRVKAVLAAGQLGEFSLRPQQGPVNVMFVPLKRVQEEAALGERVNTLVSTRPAEELTELIRSAYALEDLGLKLRARPEAGAVQFESATGVLSPAMVEKARAAGPEAEYFTYLATAIKAGGKETPYSIVGATDLAQLGFENLPEDGMVLSDWAARDLGARVGDAVTLDYMMWRDTGEITNESAQFRVAGVVPMRGLAADRNLSPEYPGITDADDVNEWDPPFPMDLKKIRPKDEDYWDEYRTAPKAWIPLTKAQALWPSRYGNVTAVRFPIRGRGKESPDRALQEVRLKLRKELDPLENGLAVIPVREQQLNASQGATDFGEYFSYFSFFLMVSALLLAGLFFRLGVEERFAQIGLLEATGFTRSAVTRLFLTEGLMVAAVGAVVGVMGALGFAWLIVKGLGTWWVDAVGTREIALAVSPGPLAAGVIGGLVAAVLAIVITLRGVRADSPRSLLAGGGLQAAARKKSRAGLVAAVAGVGAMALIGAGAAKAIPAAGAFFGAGTLALTAALAAFRVRLGRPVAIRDAGGLAVRNAGARPGRTVLSAALIAAATFLVVSVEAFRHSGSDEAGTGGYALIAESAKPLVYDANSKEGRESLNLSDVEGVKFTSFRLRPGDDASCLNLYKPSTPRILGSPKAFLDAGRFRFASGNWGLLDQDLPDGAVPAIGDQNSLMYVLHKGVGDLIEVDGHKLRIVGALSGSVLQGELIIAERHFLREFPEVQGYRTFLIDGPVAAAGDLENALSDYGFDATPTAEKLAAYHRVENTYLSTFQTLGALGLLLGTIGLAAVLIRNVVERRRELALLEAVGYARTAISRLVLRENLLILAVGLGAGVGAAALAIAPVIASRGADFSWAGIAMLVAAVGLTGVVATVLATRVAIGKQLTAALRVLCVVLAAGLVAQGQVSTLRPGMKGTGRTVFAGTKVETFDVEILGVLENFGPKQSLILGRISGGPLAHSGVMQGMSGSPVYVDGKLIGAVAMAFPFAKDPIAGIRPIEEMLRQAPGAQRAGAAEWPRGPEAIARLLPEPGAGVNRMTDIATPLGMGGFSRGTLEQFAPALRRLGLEPMQGGMGGAASGNGGGGALEPGSMISVQLMRGDMTMGADGTVTHINGNRIYAFGHRFLSVGATELPFAKAEVLALLPNVSTSFKISAAREFAGTMLLDHNTAVAGEIGRRPQLVPVTIRVKGAGLSESYKMELARDRLLTPFLAQLATYSALDATERLTGAATIRTRGAITWADGTKAALDNVYSGPTATPLIASLAAAAPLSYAMQTGFADLTPRSVELEMEVEERERKWQIEQLWASKDKAKAGDTVTISASLAGSGGRTETRSVTWTVPANIEAGTVQMTLSEAPVHNLMEFAYIASEPPSTAAQVREIISGLAPNDTAMLRIWRAAATPRVRGHLLSRLPPSTALVLKESPGVSATASAYGEKLAALPFRAPDGVVSGTKTLTLEIEK